MGMHQDRYIPICFIYHYISASSLITIFQLAGPNTTSPIRRTDLGMMRVIN